MSDKPKDNPTDHLSAADINAIDKRLEMRSRENTKQVRNDMPNSTETTPAIEQVFALLNHLPDEELPANLVNNTLKYIESNAHQDAKPEKRDSQPKDKRPPLHG